MTEAQEQVAEIKAPAKRKVKRKTKRTAAPKAEKPAKATGEFAGITANKCPDACTPGRCVISTVDICKHPYKSSINGCGPVTLANMAKARKLIKHQMVELKG